MQNLKILVHVGEEEKLTFFLSLQKLKYQPFGAKA
jgi:hypothetical protein